MKFFLPLANNAEQAERVYLRIVDHLKHTGLEVRENRIYKVIYWEEGQLKSETVGAASANGEIVLAIFQNEVGYFVCTYSTGAVWGEPAVANYLTVKLAEKFEAE